MQHLRLLVTIMIVFTTGLLMAAPAKPAVPVKTDSSFIAIRHFDPEAIKRYSKQPEFIYTTPNAGLSLWTRFWRWFWHLFDWIHLEGTGGSILFILLKYLFIGLGLAALIFLILRLTGTDIRNIWSRRSANVPLDYSESMENIHEINFDADIEKALSNLNYRLAVRLLYLKSLKQLSDNGLIKWQPDKTNQAYISELTSHAQHDAFARLTRQFEFIWYGEFFIDSNTYKQIQQQFQQFKTSSAA